MKQLNQYRLDCAQKQKRGLHFILASVVIWCAMTVIYFSELPILTKNLFAFICTGMLLPLSFLISKIINVDFQKGVCFLNRKKEECGTMKFNKNGNINEIRNYSDWVSGEFTISLLK